MKTWMIGIAAAALMIGAWQRLTFGKLHGDEARMTSALSGKQTPTDAPPQPAGEGSPIANPVSAAEMTALSAAVFAMREEFETERFQRLRDETGLSNPILAGTLERLSSTQLRSIIESWPGGESPGKERSTGIHRFMLLAGRANPSAALPLIYELLKERGERNVPGLPGNAFRAWFRQDPEGLLRWALQAGVPEGFGGLCATWTDAALFNREPSADNLRKLLAHKFGWDNWARNEVVLKLPNQEARLAFFQNLHAVTGGVYDDFGVLVHNLADRLPFTQLAWMADNAPDFKPSKLERRSSDELDLIQLGSLRQAVADSSRDGTAAQRWAWLTQREADRPSGKFLAGMVDGWCRNDYADTAAWVRGLPQGQERDTITKAVVTFLKNKGAGHLASEWQPAK